MMTLTVAMGSKAAAQVDLSRMPMTSLAAVKGSMYNIPAQWAVPILAAFLKGRRKVFEPSQISSILCCISCPPPPSQSTSCTMVMACVIPCVAFSGSAVLVINRQTTSLSDRCIYM